MLMGGIIVENDMDGLTVGDLGVDGVEEADELLMAVALHVLADDGAIEDVERGKERGRPMSLVIVGHGAEASLFHRQTGLGAVERLDLGFLVHREHDGVGRRIDIEADNVAQLSGEVRIVGELELPPAIGLEAVCLPDAPDRAGADAGGLGHHVTGPVRRLPGRITERQRDDPFGDFGGQWLDPRRPRLVAKQPIDACLGETFLPAPYTGLRLARPVHDLGGAEAIGAQQDNLGPPHMLLRSVAIANNTNEPVTVGRRNGERYPCAHASDSHAHTKIGIPNRTLPLGNIH